MSANHHRDTYCRSQSLRKSGCGQAAKSSNPCRPVPLSIITARCQSQHAARWKQLTWPPRPCTHVSISRESQWLFVVPLRRPGTMLY
nr:hypothetical protein CFP56_04212 [Quercus suber]